jgi:hypothetical protein
MKLFTRDALDAPRTARVPGQSIDALAAALYVWVVSVALPMAHRLAPLAARVAAALAFVVAVAGGLLLRRTRPLVRLIAVFAFIGTCGAAWILGRAALVGMRLDPWLGACGSAGWALWAVTWARSSRESERPNRAGLGGGSAEPRAEMPRPAIWFTAVGCTSAASILVFAWWVADRGRAMAGHGVALVGAALVAVASLSIGCHWATPSAIERAFGRQPRLARQALWQARWPMLLVLAIALCGLLGGSVSSWLR